ncbi:hypothetical protein L9F63_019344, partial [Diploptera punctata]
AKSTFDSFAANDRHDHKIKLYENYSEDLTFLCTCKVSSAIKFDLQTRYSAIKANDNIMAPVTNLKLLPPPIVDGFASQNECNKLMELAQVAAVQGDGYLGNKSPHTNYEKFEGVTLGRVALLVYFGLIEVEILDIYLKLSEMGRDYLERYFNLKTELYFTYTHLVCRSALAVLKFFDNVETYSFLLPKDSPYFMNGLQYLNVVYEICKILVAVYMCVYILYQITFQLYISQRIVVGYKKLTNSLKTLSGKYTASGILKGCLETGNFVIKTSVALWLTVTEGLAVLNEVVDH